MHDFSKEKATFADVKKALKSYADSKASKSAESTCDENYAMLSGPRQSTGKQFAGACFNCKKKGHRAAECRVSKCTFCQKPGHTEAKCWKKHGKANQGSDGARSNFSSDYQFSTSEGSVCRGQLVVDSGCTSHMFNDKKLFVEMNRCTRTCVNANSTVSSVTGSGTVKIGLKDISGRVKVVTLRECLYLPDNARNLLSVSRLAAHGAKAVFDHQPRFVFPDGVEFNFRAKGGLYEMECYPVEEYYAVKISKVSVGDTGTDEWVIATWPMLQDCPLPVPECMMVRDDGRSFSDCKACARRRRHTDSSRVHKSEKRGKRRKLELVYSDVTGPMETTSMGSQRFAISFIDSYRRYAKSLFHEDKGGIARINSVNFVLRREYPGLYGQTVAASMAASSLRRSGVLCF